MASKWKLPVIYICENNRYGMGTAIARVSPVPEIYKRAAAYDMRGEPVDGMDVLKMYERGEGRRRVCRAGKGPVLLEANTYRFRGHSMSDAATYRTKKRWRRSARTTPSPSCASTALKKKIATEAEFERSTRR